MPYATTKDNVKLYYEEAGSGTPILFVHEFAGDHRNWEPQMRYFCGASLHHLFGARLQALRRAARRRDYSYKHCDARCDRGARPSQDRQGASRRPVDGRLHTRCARLHHPERVLSLTLAGAGSGSERGRHGGIPKTSRRPRKFEQRWLGRGGEELRHGRGRIPFQVKDPRGFADSTSSWPSTTRRARPTRCAVFRAAGRRSTISRPTSARSTCRR